MSHTWPRKVSTSGRVARYQDKESGREAQKRAEALRVETYLLLRIGGIIRLPGIEGGFWQLRCGEQSQREHPDFAALAMSPHVQRWEAALDPRWSLATSLNHRIPLERICFSRRHRTRRTTATLWDPTVSRACSHAARFRQHRSGRTLIPAPIQLTPSRPDITLRYDLDGRREAILSPRAYLEVVEAPLPCCVPTSSTGVPANPGFRAGHESRNRWDDRRKSLVRSSAP